MESFRKKEIIDIETKAERGLVQNPIAPAGESEIPTMSDAVKPVTE
jgi:hypothetical protein